MDTEKSNQLVTTPIAIIIGSVLISIAILVNGGAIKIKGFNSGTTGTTGDALASSAPIAAAPEEPTGPVKVSLDDDPVLGDPNAPVTLVEFSDYECPFCKRHYDQTHAQLKTEYIDTGKVKLVFRDLPLSFHDPLATKEAIAANCAREQGNDQTYYQMHDAIFETTTSNGSGMTMDQLYGLAAKVGINQDAFKTCIDADKYKDEVAKDLADAGNAGASGTPSFVIAKSTGSEVEGKLVVGAQPFAAFKSEIDALLQ
jgi:protein-disulfide isomerase